MIDLMPDADDADLESAARSFLEASLPGPRLTALAAADEPFDRPLLRRCGELGWFGLTLDEVHGGTGLSVAQECLVFREIGRYLLPGPVLATALAALAASAAGDAALAGLLSSAEALAGLAEVVPGLDRLVVWDPGPVDLLLVADPAAGTLQLVEAAGVTGETVATIDPLTHLRWVAPASLPDPVCAAADAAALLQHGVLLIAAMLTGIAEQVRDASAGYAKVRVQFGRPIGTFQAVKHRCADMALRAEAAWAQTEVAALRFGAHGAAAAFDVAAAKVVASDAAIRNARDNIQNHGGIGFTAEHSAHLFLKRAHVLEQQLGATRAHLRAVLTAPVGW